MDWGLIAAGVLIAVGQWLKSRSPQTEGKPVPPSAIPPEQSERVSPTLPTGTAPPTSTGEPRGLRNNNPLNIKWNPANNWRGQVGKDDAGFVVYDSVLNGLRAGFKLLKTYRTRYGVSTVSAVIRRWAPPVENDTEAYISIVVQRSTLGRNQHVRTRDEQVDLIRAMVYVENGQQPYPREVYEDAYNAAYNS